jgi:hypothetical protein
MRPLSSHHTLQSGYKECYPSTKESYAYIVRGDPPVQKLAKSPIVEQKQQFKVLKGG